jgi:hypothetical protein
MRYGCLICPDHRLGVSGLSVVQMAHCTRSALAEANASLSVIVNWKIPTLRRLKIPQVEAG